MALGVWWGHFKGTHARSWAENWCSSEGQSAFLQRTILQLSNTALRSCGQKKLYWSKVKRSFTVVHFLSIQPCSGLPSLLLRPCNWTELLTDPWPNQCGMRSVTVTGNDKETPYGPRLLPGFCCLQPARQSFELSSHQQISLLLSPLWKKGGRTISLDQVWTDKNECPCELLWFLTRAKKYKN